jgi:ATP-dependent helicase/nuclease subunit B
VLSVWTLDAIPERSSSAPTIRSVLSWAVAALAPLTALWRQGRASLNDWSTALRDVLVATEAWADLQADPAGAMVISSLRLTPEETAAGTDGWLALLEATRVDGRTALTWMQEVLEAAVFRPTLPEGLSPEVVVTTLARAALRPFESVVVPGADSRQLGGLTSSPGWLSQSQRETMGLSTPRDQQQAQWDAFELVMCTPAVVCLHHQDHDGELVSASPWLQRWQLAHGQLWARAEPPWVTRWLEPQPVTPPAPAVHRRPDLVDVRMTATKYEALRQCPYQFFAKAILALDEAEELAEGVDGADYGNVLHLILQRYHEQRDLQVTQRDPAQEVAAWLQAAQDVIQEEGMAHDSHRAFFRPYQQQLERLAWAYVAWLIGHEREGWSVRHMEFLAQLTVPVGAQSHLRLEGRLDRMDVRHHSSHGEERHVIDYKSGQLDQLKKKLKTPLEDTQLLFYALLGGQPEGLQASYLHLGKDAGPKAEAGAMKASLLPHDDVGHHADQLLDGLVHDWQRILDGHGLPALGEGATCTHCRYRGLCRQDDWSTT